MLCYNWRQLKAEDRIRASDLYKEYRKRCWQNLWSDDVPRFNAASAEERNKTVAVIRAAGVVFAESGPSGFYEKQHHSADESKCADGRRNKMTVGGGDMQAKKVNGLSRGCEAQA